MKGRKFKEKPSLWPGLSAAAWCIRGDPTPAEELVWGRFRDRRFHGLNFRRQHSAGGFIVDFIYPDKSLLGEIDAPDSPLHQAKKSST